MVDFRPLNLLQPFDHLGTFDIVYCRNVLIYFDAATKGDVLRRIADQLAPDGAVLLGAAETVIGITETLMPDPEHRGLYRHGRAAAPMGVAASGVGTSTLGAPAAMPAPAGLRWAVR
jgi:chemotaxis protein methyltransferase CheR